MAIVVNIQYSQNRDNRRLGTFSLSFIDEQNITHSVDMKFGFEDLWTFAHDMESTAFDFLILSLVVYNVDRAINRLKFSLDGWHRSLIINCIPVKNVAKMQHAVTFFESAVNFLTGDTWFFNFIQAPEYDYRPTIQKTFERGEFDKVCLFSGGLDSLIGFIDEASSLLENRKILLVSHKELGKEGGDQKRILDICREKGFYNNQYERVLVNAGLKPKTWVNKSGAEGTFRSRSLLFFAAGIYVAHSISDKTSLIVPENGTISINIPLDKGRRGACSTRTTHPTFIKRIQNALTKIGINNTIINPYQLKSKADMMIECYMNDDKKRILSTIYSESCSCAKRSHNRWWDRRGGNIRHCGHCLPCIYRRVALDIVGADNIMNIGTDMFDSRHFKISDTKQESSNDIRSLIYFLEFRCNRKNIEHELRLNGITNEDELLQYTELALHSYEQVKTWLIKENHDRYPLPF